MLVFGPLFFFGAAPVGARHGQERIYYYEPREPLMPGKAAGMLCFGLGDVGGYITASAGTEVERFIDRTHLLSATLKITGYHGGHLFSAGEIDVNEIRSNNYGYFIAPGARFHPWKNTHEIDFSNGASLAVGKGFRDDSYRLGYGTGSGALVSGPFGAVLGEAVANFQGRQSRAIFSLFLFWGYIYADAEARKYRTPQSGGTLVGRSDPGYVQFGLRVGGRW